MRRCLGVCMFEALLMMSCVSLWAVFVAPCSQRRCSVLQWNPDVATQLVVASEDDRTPTLQMWDLRNHHSPVKEFVGHVKVGSSSSSHGSGHGSCVHNPCTTNGMLCMQSPSVSTCSVWIVVADPVMYHETAATVMQHINCKGPVPTVHTAIHGRPGVCCAVLCCAVLQGVLGMSWCPQDHSLLLSSSKDQRTICWDVHTTDIVCEMPTHESWAFDVQVGPAAAAAADQGDAVWFPYRCKLLWGEFHSFPGLSHSIHAPWMLLLSPA